MKKALLLTDASVDQALLLCRWLENQSEPLDLTVVYGYEINQSADQSLKAAVYQEAKEEATAAISHWLNFLSKSCSSRLHTELLLGDPEHVLTIHLLLRRYDYLLLNGWQQSVLSTYESYRHQILTQLKCICTPDRSVFSLRRATVQV